MDSNANDPTQIFAEYALEHHMDSLVEILAAPDLLQHYSIIVNFATLFEENIDLGNAIEAVAESILPLCDEGLILAQKKIIDTSDCDKKDLYSLKNKVHARITALPSNQTVFPRNEELGTFIKVSGTVVKVTLPKLLEYERAYRCSKCGLTQNVTADFHLSNQLRTPTSCPGNCIPTFFTPVKEETVGKYKDYQELKIQEELGKLHMGTIPNSIWVTLDNDLVDTCHPGDHVTVYGTAMRRWKSLRPQEKSEIELVVKANNIQVSNDQKSTRLVTDEAREKFTKFWEAHKAQPLVGRDIILASFSPDVYGLYLVKLAMCIVLSGGVARVEEGGSFVRAESHLLLVGDPGTGKSQLLRFAAKTAARAVLTTGVGSTSAGLTVCAVREGSDWQLEAGALVLADGGVCCIDELSSIREQDRTSIHEAMEQQTISVAKAGMVTKLNTRCSILAATNAKGPYDPSESLCVNVALASPLLSRFDLILILQDTRSEDWDRLLSSFILELSTSAAKESPELWSFESLQSYFAVVKTYQPVMTRAANLVLSRYYQAQRSADMRSAARTTVRMLESLVRLSQGHARLMMQTEVTLMDAVVAVTLVECSMAASALVSSANALHSAFPLDPQNQLRHQAELILNKLDLKDQLAEELSKLYEDFPSILLKDKATTFTRVHPSRPTSCENLEHNMPPEDSHSNFTQQRVTSLLSGEKKDRDINEILAIATKRPRSTSSEGINKKLIPEKERKINGKCKVSRKKSDGDCIPFESQSFVDKTSRTVADTNSDEDNMFIDRGGEMQFETSCLNLSPESKSTKIKLHGVDIPDVERQSAFRPISSIGTQFHNETSSNEKQLSKIFNGDVSKNVAEEGRKRIKPNMSFVEKLKVFKYEQQKKRGKETGQIKVREENVGNNFVCDKSLISSTPLAKGEAPRFETSVIVPTPLLTNGGKPTCDRGFDINKLKALAKVGKSLSQSQSLVRTDVKIPVEKQFSEFVLSDMSWDDVDLEIK